MGCAFEYFWLVGFERLDKQLKRKQRIITGTVLLSVAAADLTYGLFQAYHLSYEQHGSEPDAFT